MFQIKLNLQKSVHILFVCMIILIGCSSGGNNSNPLIPGDEISSPEITDSELRGVSEDGGHVLLGYSMIYLDATDPENIKAEMVPVRLGEIHMNILSLLESGICGECYEITSIDLPLPDVVDFEIKITHPVDNKYYTLFDVRGIMMFDGSHLFPESGLTMSDSSMGDCELLNPEGYTTLYNGSTFGLEPPLSAYVPGVFATMTIPDSGINGFLRYGESSNHSARNYFKYNSNKSRSYSIQIPASGEFSVGYAVDASWDVPSTSVNINLNHFPETANCPEPWRIDVSGSSIYGNGSTSLIMDVFDWQGKSTHGLPRIECPELFSGLVFASYVSSDSQDGYSRWEATIENSNGAAPGKYRCLISVMDFENAGIPDHVDLIARQIFEVDVNPSSNQGYLMGVTSAYGPNIQYGSGITTLSDDSIVVTGGYTSIMIFGEGESNETIIDSGSNYGSKIYLARYNHDGNLMWAKPAIDYPDPLYLREWIHDIVVLSDNSTVMTGYAQGILIARHAPDGTLMWMKRSGAFSDTGTSITSLSDDSIMVTGRFNGIAKFGEGEPGETILQSDGYEDTDLFVARYNPDGTLAWAKSDGGTGTTIGYGITALSDHSTIVTGYFKGTVRFGEGEPNATLLTSFGYYGDMFIARYHPDGSLIWAQQVGDTSYDSARAITTLSDDSVVISGNSFLARYNPEGTLVWASQAGGDGYGITALSDDSTVVTGWFRYATVFGYGGSNDAILIPYGDYDLFVARYNSDGVLTWVSRAGGSASVGGYDISVLSDDSTVVTGGFKRDVTFGDGELFESELQSSDHRWDMFMARFSP